MPVALDFPVDEKDGNAIVRGAPHCGDRGFRAGVVEDNCLRAARDGCIDQVVLPVGVVVVSC